MDEKGAVKNKKLEYIESEKLSMKDLMTTIPSELKSTPRISWLFSTIFLIVIIVGFLQSPVTGILSGSIDFTMKIGYPMTFFEFSVDNAEDFPFKLYPLLVDLLLYLLIAYIIDVAINVFLKSSFSRSFKKRDDRVGLYKVEKS